MAKARNCDLTTVCPEAACGAKVDITEFVLKHVVINSLADTEVRKDVFRTPVYTIQMDVSLLPWQAKSLPSFHPTEMRLLLYTTTTAIYCDYDYVLWTVLSL
jgi:hypothetical protein